MKKIALIISVIMLLTSTFVYASPDVTPPTPGGNGVISTSNITSTSVTLGWTAATDDYSAQEDLEYKVVLSTSDNINTLETAKKDGITVVNWTTNITTATASNLTPRTTYYFNVLVKDEKDKDTMAVYTCTSAYTLTYKIVDTNETYCYDNTFALATYPIAGEDFYGQDAQYIGYQKSYTLSSDGKTVYDNVTELTWQSSPNMTNTIPVYSDKLTVAQAQSVPAAMNAVAYGGFTDWRLPTLKELYSLIQFSGQDPSGYTGTDTSVLPPFIDTNYFKFAHGFLPYERIIDAQYYSDTTFIVNPAERGYQKQFGVNFADGRIKGYDVTNPSGDKTFLVQCVRGNTNYGINNFTDNGDDTITDKATGLMWSKNDNGFAMSWKDALAWVQTKNAENYLGHSDWRLPNAKELQSIVDYGNAPEYNGKPALNTMYFNSTSITNELGELDYPYYWTGTTHASYVSSTLNNVGRTADYVAFGRALGLYINSWIDVHGAGAQRSDPKNTDLSTYRKIIINGITGYSHGPQGDAIRAINFARLVRDAN